MANDEHLKRLNEGVRAWGNWRVYEDPEVQPDLSEADLIGANLIAARLNRANLGWADLIGANLTMATLNRAYLRQANLSGANLSTANVRQANLSGANLTRACLIGADLRGADLSGADLSEADLRDSIWRGVLLQSTNLSNVQWEGVRFLGPCGLDPETVRMSAGLPESFLRGCGWPERLIEYWPSISGQGIDLYSGFISYSHRAPDQSFARRLHDGLQGRGIRIWRDEHELVPGDPVMGEIDRGIRLWDKTLLCCSEASLESWWVKREIEKAIQKERAIHDERGETVFALIPLDLDGYLLAGWKHQYKSYITERLAANFTGWESDNAKFEAQFERVVRAMTPGGCKPPPPEPML